MPWVFYFYDRQSKNSEEQTKGVLCFWTDVSNSLRGNYFAKPSQAGFGEA
jgi:hypothetical protein